MTKQKLLIVDDDVDICMLLKRFFERKGFVVSIAFKGGEGLEILKNEKIDLVLTDFRLPDKDGLEMISLIKKINDELPIIVITGYSEVNQAVKVIRLGAYEYVTKPIYPEEILLLVKDALKTTKDTAKNKEFENEKAENKEKQPLQETQQASYLIPEGSSSKKVQQLIKRVAPTEITVVILGESGTGKEVIARMIHEASDRKNHPFVPVDCGALTQELAASELFGHLKGAFTGATSDKKGSFELANHGTLFLDEIGNLSYENQVKLLRVLQERVIRKVGSEKDMPIDVRIIVATNEDLHVAMQKNTFREDVFYRINEFKIELKPLRENKNDLNAYVQFFLQQSNAELNKSVVELAEDAWEVLMNYSWPGNIRELKNAIKFAILMTENDVISKANLPNDILHPKKNSGNNNSHDVVDDDGITSLRLKDVVAKSEKQAILKAFSLVDNNRTKAAEILGIDRKTLYNKLHIYDLIE